MKTSSKDEINRLLNSKLYTLLVKCINEQFKTSKALIEINYFKSSLLTTVNDNDYSMSQYNNNTNSNYVETLVKLIIYKRNTILDSLTFSLFKKISQLTPRLFGSIFSNNEEINLFCESIVNRLKSDKPDAQAVNSIAKFLCTLVEFQPSFFHLLADINIKKTNEDKTVYEEGSKSIFKCIFYLLENLNENKLYEQSASTAGIQSLFYTIWHNKKYEYINYLRQR
jgi:hypothetical protein